MSNTQNNGINFFRVTLDHFDQGLAVLTSEIGQFKLPIKLLPHKIVEGDQLVITVATEKADRETREISAKEILNQVLEIKK